MDVDRNELISGEEHERLKQSDPKEASRFEQVLKTLWPAARQKLHGKDRAFVSRTSGGKLSSWAAKRRKEKQRRHMVKLSRRNNR